jgi:hypothetical protein
MIAVRSVRLARVKNARAAAAGTPCGGKDDRAPVLVKRPGGTRVRAKAEIAVILVFLRG